jgi:hypothetical protein
MPDLVPVVMGHGRAAMSADLAWVMTAEGAIAIDAIPYFAYISTKFATRPKRLDERRDCAAAGSRTQAAVSIAGVYETFVRTTGIAKEKVAQANPLRILTAGDDVEDEDEDIGDAEAIDDCDR